MHFSHLIELACKYVLFEVSLKLRLKIPRSNVCCFGAYFLNIADFLWLE